MEKFVNDRRVNLATIAIWGGEANAFALEVYSCLHQESAIGIVWRQLSQLPATKQFLCIVKQDYGQAIHFDRIAEFASQDRIAATAGCRTSGEYRMLTFRCIAELGELRT